MKLSLVLHNIRSTYNVGAILRTAEGFGVQKVYLSGYTPATSYTKSVKSLPHLLEKTTAQIAKTALGAEQLVDCLWSEDVVATLKRLKSEGVVIFGLENNINQEHLVKLVHWREALARIIDKDMARDACFDNLEAVLILGEEVEGIDKVLYRHIDFFLEIPMVGKKESFNVSVATGIALYELLGRD